MRFGFSHFGSTAGAARSVTDHLKIEIGSVGSERSRSLARRLARFVTDKTLLLSESGNPGKSPQKNSDGNGQGHGGSV